MTKSIPEKLALRRKRKPLMVLASDAGLIVGQIRAICTCNPRSEHQLYIDNLGSRPQSAAGHRTRLLQDVLLWGTDRGCVEAWSRRNRQQRRRGLYKGS